MSPTRRQVVSAIAVGGMVPGTVATAEAQEGEDQGFSPDITINDNNLVATIGDRDGDVDPDTVTIYTANGDHHQFEGAAPNDQQAGGAFEVGYTHDRSRARIEGWHGVIDGVTATKDGQTVSATNGGGSTLEVTCSLWKTPDQPPTQFEVLSEGARKQHFSRGQDDLSEDQRRYGSPGRSLKTVAERNRDIAMRVDFDSCRPETEKALRFDCTSVTVEPEELNQGEERIHDVQLRFADGTFESPPGTANDADDGAFEVPVTLSGSGDNEGKVVERLEFKVPGGEYTYWNLEADQCAARQSSGSDDGRSGDDSDTGGDGNTSDDGNDGGGTNDDATGGNDGGDEPSGGSGDDSGNQGPGADSDSGGGSSPSGDATGSRDGDSDGGSGGGSGSGSSDSSSGGSDGSSDDDSGGLLDDDATETPTPNGSNTQNVTVNGTDRTSGRRATGTATDSGTPGNGSTGGGNGPASGSSDPGIATGTPAEDQPGLGFAAGLGGLLGFGEFARRKLGVEDEE